MSAAFAMDEKQRPEKTLPYPYSHQVQSSRDETQPSWHPSSLPVYRDRSLRRICTAICILLATWAFTRSLLPYLSACDHPNNHHDHHQQQSSGTPEVLVGGQQQQPSSHISSGNPTRNKVSLEAHIMSKCPDAKACLQELVVPAMEKISDKVDFKLSFIGSIDPTSDAITCPHGPPECLGDLILLCASTLYPSPKLSLGFANCLIADYRAIPERALVEACAMEHGLDFGRINACISDDGGEAQALLRESVEGSREAGVRTSCTVRLGAKVWCVTDESGTGEGRDCNDGGNLGGLVRDVEEAYAELNS